jgi:hypothetical protein
VFNLDDAHDAATRLLALGPIRIKNPASSGGGGQRVAGTIEEVEVLLKGFSGSELDQTGLVLEANLQQVTTLSVGQVTVDRASISYHGTQRVTKNNHGRSVYGGSNLICVRGEWEALAAVAMSDEVRLGVAQARTYDRATGLLPGFIASRRNYDVGQGVDGRNTWRSGVLEASWRSGGASTAELAALAIFLEEPECRRVEVAAIKQFGRLCVAPRGATIHYHGDDPRDGPVLRYTVVRRKYQDL